MSSLKCIPFFYGGTRVFGFNYQNSQILYLKIKIVTTLILIHSRLELQM